MTFLCLPEALGVISALTGEATGLAFLGSGVLGSGFFEAGDLEGFLGGLLALAGEAFFAGGAFLGAIFLATNSTALAIFPAFLATGLAFAAFLGLALAAFLGGEVAFLSLALERVIFVADWMTFLF